MCELLALEGRGLPYEVGSLCPLSSLFSNSFLGDVELPLKTTVVAVRNLLGMSAPSFTRATTKYILNNDGYMVQIKAGEVGFEGARRIENLYTNTATVSIAGTKSATVAAGTYVFSMGAGTGTATFSGTSGVTGTLEASASGRVSVVKSVSAGTFVITGSVATLTDVQLENVTGQTTQTAGEYVSNGGEKLNYLLDTNDFSTANWVITNVTLTKNQIANPIDGAVNVQKATVTATASTALRYTGTATAQSTTVTASMYLSTNSNRASMALLLRNNTTATNFTGGVFVPATGAVSGAGWASTLVSPGWYMVTYTQASGITIGDALWLYMGATGGSLNAGDYWHVYGPQINSGSTALDYYPVGNVYPFHGAMVDGVKHFDTDINDVVISSATLLGPRIELSRTNLLLQSQTFGNASWVKTDVTPNEDATAAPDGTLTADLLAEGSAGTATITQTVTITADSNFVLSCHLKYGNTPLILFQFGNGSNVVRLWFNVQTGVVISSTVGGTATLIGAEVFQRANGFYRLVLTGSLGSGLTTGTFQFSSSDADGSLLKVSGATYYAWGAQFENNVTTFAFATSYIPTTTASVTRNADVLTYDLPALTSGTLYCKGSVQGSFMSSGAVFACLDDGTTSNQLFVSGRPNAGAQDTTRAEIFNGGASTAQININSSSLLSQRKTAISFATNVIDAATEGTLGTQDTSSAIPSTTKLRIGATSAAQSLCNVRDVKILKNLNQTKVRSLTQGV